MKNIVLGAVLALGFAYTGTVAKAADTTTVDLTELRLVEEVASFDAQGATVAVNMVKGNHNGGHGGHHNGHGGGHGGHHNGHGGHHNGHGGHHNGHGGHHNGHGGHHNGHGGHHYYPHYWTGASTSLSSDAIPAPQVEL